MNHGHDSSVFTINLSIRGMTCASCVARVERALKKLPTVVDAQVNLATEQASVTMSAPDRQDVIAAITQIGYEVLPNERTLLVSGMTCAACVTRLERALQRIDGVVDAKVNLATEQAHVSGYVDEAVLLEAVAAAGFSARSMGDGAWLTTQDQDEQRNTLRRNVWLAGLLALPVLVLEMGGHLFGPFHHWITATIGLQSSWLIQWLLTSLIMLLPGRHFYRLGVPALLRGAPDMNSLVAVGSLAAYGYSLVATFWPAWLPDNTVYVYYEAVAMIVALILLGRLLEARAKGRTSEAIKHLMGLQVRTAHVVRDGQVVDLDINEVSMGDIIEVRPGERIAVDGVVVAGHSWVDEAMISGEAVPIEKQVAAHVTGGTVNQQGVLRLRATAVGEATVLAQIIRMVSAAQAGKLPIQTLVDRVTLWFVPTVMVLALLTLVVWWLWGPEPRLNFALVNAVAVLIIACPCAMGLATPTSIMIATGRGAELGVLFRQGSALQALSTVQVVAVDKTGTLTEGKPVLTDLHVAAGFERQRVLAQIAAVESQSEHPIARAMVAAAHDAGLSLPPVLDFQSVTGLGTQATVDGHIVIIGADRYMQQQGLSVAEFAAVAQDLAVTGKSPLYAAIDGQLAAILAVADPIKPSTAAALKALHDLGLRVVMISGDNRHTAAAIAKQLGIDEVVAEVMPDGKVATIAALQHQHSVAFVGDGINDAPALAQADVGLAVGTGTDIAMEAADVVLMSGRLTAVADAIALSRASMRNIKQNLFWAFAYNAALIPIAAGVLYPFWHLLLSPMFAAAAMSLSSVFVLSNALRLRRFKA